MFSDPKLWQSGDGLKYAKNWIKNHEAAWNAKVASAPPEILKAAPKIFVEPAVWKKFRKSIS